MQRILLPFTFTFLPLQITNKASAFSCINMAASIWGSDSTAPTSRYVSVNRYEDFLRASGAFTYLVDEAEGCSRYQL